MPQDNPYVPPIAQVADVQSVAFRDDYGLRLGASLFWRALLFQFTVAALVALAMLPVHEPIFIRLKPTAIYFCLALVYAMPTLVVKSGALSLVWGHRIRMAPALWRRLNWMLFGLYLVLALGNVALVITVPIAVWVQAKVYLPLFSLAALCAAAPRLLRRVA